MIMGVIPLFTLVVVSFVHIYLRDVGGDVKPEQFAKNVFVISGLV
jgi:hypothetical protein